MAHQVAHHIHVNATGVKTGPGITLAPRFYDDVESISFQSGGVIEITHHGHVHRLDFHDIDDITCSFVLNTAVTFTIHGNA